MRPTSAQPQREPGGGDPDPAVVLAGSALERVYDAGVAVRALDGVDVEFRRGQFTAVMGPSGSGKSTLLHCLAGLDKPTAGHVLLGDTDLTKLTPREVTRVRRDRMGFVFQAYNLVPVLTVSENITLTARLGRRPVDRSWLRTLASRLGLRPSLDRRPDRLSGGQQQRVAIARALFTRPEVVFADEPTGNLDSTASADVLSLLRDAVDGSGQTVVMVTHDPAAAAHADRVLFLADGRCQEELAPVSVAAIAARIRPGGRT